MQILLVIKVYRLFIISYSKEPMEGTLEVWHGFFSRWVNYYFRTHEDTLIFGPKKQQIQGKVHLKVAQIISIVDDPISFIIHTGTDTLRLRANSIQERVKWFKKLKRMQKSIEEENYVKEISSLNYEKNKSNKIKMLESIVLDLWQCHAELESQIDDIFQRFKAISAVKGLTDKLRMTVQSIKLKNSEALKIIEEYTRSEREKRGATSNRYGNSPIYEESQNSDYQEPNGTMFMSFEQNRNKLFKKVSKRQSEEEMFKDVPTLNRKSITQNESSQVTPFKMQSSIKRLTSSRNLNFENPLKQKLLDTNVVFMQIKKNITDNKTRSVLPEKFTPEQKFPIGSVLKGAVGADLTKFALPVTINEPLSMLQKGCEQMYYSKLLDQANDQDKPEKRMLYVVAFLISQYSLSDLRIKKPFNPLLGQTFQYYDQQRQFTYVSQQVSHHPPITAMYCYSDTFQVLDQSKAKTSFTGTSIKIIPEGKSKIRLQRFSDQEYYYDKCTICLNNLVVGKTQLEIVGEINIQCPKTKANSTVVFKQQGFFSKSGLHQIEGDIKMNGQKCYTLSGKWNESVKATDLTDKTVINAWNRKHQCNKDYYYFNEYTMLLNHLNKRNLAEIAPTDSRLRPDQRALQYRMLDLAESEKLRLEQKQRAKRKENEDRKIQHKIKWFNLVKDELGNELYVINQNYENQRSRGQWSHYPDIF